MISFEGLYFLVEKSSHETAFNKEECRALFSLLTKLPNESVIVEIGVEFGRSTTVIGYMAKKKKFDFTAIDNWSGEYGPQAKEHVENLLIKEWGLPIKLWSMSSRDAFKKYPRDIMLDLVHIDGDHSYSEVVKDILRWATKTRIGGYICFDDFGHDSLPDVYRACKDFMIDKPEYWKFIGRYGNKLGVFQRI